VRRRSAVASLMALVVAAGCGTGAESNVGDTTGTPTVAQATPGAVAIQMRPVESTVVPALDGYDQVEPTCGAGAAAPCTDAQLLDPDGITLQASDGTRAGLGELVIDGSNVASASAVGAGDPAEWVVQLTLDHEGTTAVATATGNAASATPPANQIAIVVDGTLLSLPVVQAPIDSGLVVVSAGFTKQEAEDLAAALGGS